MRNYKTSYVNIYTGCYISTAFLLELLKALTRNNTDTVFTYSVLLQYLATYYYSIQYSLGLIQSSNCTKLKIL